ncbi:ABC transporter substrate-binding protein [Microbacterium suaedae]|uniref:ABC transporter substrate-binding protein n=1 Tax=Microbacterium suaedae TaxID=2067813 RepID=UPI000DA12BC1|nr:extracellular solute-binding protein [Microbacterium suaedae]
MRKQRLLAAGGTVAVAAAALTACSGGAAEATCTNEIKKEDATQVSVWAWYPAFEQVVDLFNETHDDIQVCWTNAGQGADEYNKFSTALEAGSGAPDVIMLESEQLPSFTIQEGLVDLSEYGADEIASEYTEGAWQDVSSGDGVYAIPVDGGPMGMLYRQDIFDEYGIEVPTTWDEFADAAQALKDAGAPGVLADFPANGGAYTYALMAQAGAEPFSYDANNPQQVGVDVNSDEAKEVMSYWNDLVEKDLVATDDAFTADYNTKLVDGTYAVYVAAAWGPGYLGGLEDADAEAQWRAAPVPQWDPNNPVQINWGGSTFAVTTHTPEERLEAAATVAKDIFRTEEAWQIGIDEAALFPLWKPVLESDEFAQKEYPFFDGQKINEDVFLEAAAGYTGFGFSPFQVYAYDQTNEQLFAMTEGEKDAATALDDLQDVLEQYANNQGFELTE